MDLRIAVPQPPSHKDEEAPSHRRPSSHHGHHHACPLKTQGPSGACSCFQLFL